MFQNTVIGQSITTLKPLISRCQFYLSDKRQFTVSSVQTFLILYVETIKFSEILYT